ncbi:MAG: RNA ligase family protein [Vicinamibacteria bacterium]
MSNSTHRVEVLRLGAIEKHPNADRLGIVKIFSGYTAVIGLDQFKEGDLVAYVPPDSVVPTTHPVFAFLKREGRDTERIKVKNLRGVVSMGLIIGPVASLGAKEGEDLAEYFGVTHYEPPEPMSTGGENAAPPKSFVPVYDVETLRRYAHVFEAGEPVWVSEKIHGANARYMFDGETLHIGSHNHWKKRVLVAGPKIPIWQRALEEQPEIETWCRTHPGWTLYGEVYGQVQDLKYGVQGVRFAAFDVLNHYGVWLNPVQAHWQVYECYASGVNGFVHRPSVGMVHWVPIIERSMPFDLDRILALAEGPSLIPGANNVREGCVVRPLEERTNAEIGRVMLKVVGNGYLERP